MLCFAIARSSGLDGAAAAMTCVRLTLLGSFELVCDGAPVTLPMSAQRVLAFVALHDHVLQRPYVAGSLWLDSLEEHAYASLRSALWRLHRCGHRLVETSRQQLALGRNVEVDLRRSQALGRCVLDEWNAEALSVGPSAFQEDVLPDWYDDWVVIERERYRQLRLSVLDALCERLTRAHRLSEALDVGLAAVAGEPLRESAHRAVVRVHLEEGNIGEAVRQYRFCRRLLKEQLGIEPSERMQELLPTLNAAEAIR